MSWAVLDAAHYVDWDIYKPAAEVDWELAAKLGLVCSTHVDCPFAYFANKCRSKMLFDRQHFDRNVFRTLCFDRAICSIEQKIAKFRQTKGIRKLLQ